MLLFSFIGLISDYVDQFVLMDTLTLGMGAIATKLVRAAATSGAGDSKAIFSPIFICYTISTL
jgi:hypothetical protein